jgi:hypothetical protein
VNFQICSPDEILSESTPSLFIFGSVTRPIGYAESRQSVATLYGHIWEMGFANNWVEPITDLSNRKHDFSSAGFVYDRFFTLRVDKSARALARIDVDESRVRDDYMRGDLDYTGFTVSLSLRDEAFRLIQDHLEQPVAQDQDDWARETSRALTLRIPAQPFAVPPTRGSADPWGSTNAVGRLKHIRSFSTDRIAVTLRSRRPLEAVAAEGSLYERYKPWLQSTLELRYE